MIVYFLIPIIIAVVGLLTYFTSAWFGCRSSGLDSLPAHYRLPSAKAAAPTEQPETTH